MKLFAFFTLGLVAAEKKRPDTINPEARLEKLQGLVSNCIADSFFDGPKRHRMTRKFARLHSIAQNYLDRMGSLDIEEDTDDARINANDPCSCLGGAAGGYKSFFNRLAEAHGEGPKSRGYRRNEAMHIQRKLLDENLNKHYDCNLPNRN